jgi:hypothetical protein
MDNTRRRYLLGAMGTLAVGAGGLGCAHQRASPLPRAGAGFVRVPVGQAHVVALSDGVVRRPLDAGFVRNATLEQVQATLAQQGLPTQHIDVPYTCFVLEVGGQRVLLDTGFADNGPAGTGLLHTHMRAAGIDPASIDVVVLSHCHGDHVNGLRRKDGTLVYPRAAVHVPAPELAFWLDTARRDAAPEAARGGFNTVRRVLQDYPAAQLRPFTPSRPSATRRATRRSRCARAASASRSWPTPRISPRYSCVIPTGR